MFSTDQRSRIHPHSPSVPSREDATRRPLATRGTSRASAATMLSRDDGGAFARATPSSLADGDTFWNRVHLAVARVRPLPETRDGGPDAGDVIVMRALEDGRARAARDGSGRAIRANRAPAATTAASAESAYVFSSARGDDEEAEEEEEALTERDASTHVVVLRFGKYYGFRSHAAGGKLLQARRSARREPCFYSFNFGVCEQWELVAIDHAAVEGDGRAMRFRNRRFERVELDVAVTRVPEEFVPRYALDDMSLYDDEIAYVEYGSASDAPPAPVSPERVVKSAPLAAPPSPIATEKKPMEKKPAETPLAKKPTKTRERPKPPSRAKPAESAPGLVSTTILEKWTRIFKEEVSVRQGVERELLGLREELKTMETSWMNSVQAVQLEFESINLQTMETMKKTMHEHAQARAREVQLITVMKALDGRRRQSTRALRDELFRRWKMATEKSRRARVAIVRFILRADKRHLGATFDSWRRYLEHAKRMRRKGTMIRRRSDGHLKRWAFDRWVERAEQTKKVHRIAARAHRRGLADKSREMKQKVLLAWYMNMKENRKIARIHRHAMRRGNAEMRHRVLLKAFSTWKRSTLEMRSFAQRLVRTFSRWNNRTVAAAFLKWREETRDSVHLRKTYSAVVLSWNKDQHKTLTRLYFAAWKVTARLARAHRFKAHAVVRRQLIVMRNQSHKTFRLAFDAWRARAEHSSFRRGVATQATLRLRNLELFKVFNGWRHRARALRTQRKNVGAVVSKLRHRALLRAWNGWKSRTHERSQTLAVSVLATYRMQSRNRMRRAFGMWRTHWRRSALVQVKQRASVRFATLNHFFSRWVRLMEMKADMQRMVVRKRVTHNLFLDWYWDTFGEEFTRLIQYGSTSSPNGNGKREVVVVDDPDVELFHTPLHTPDKTFWSPPKPRRIML